MYETDHKRSKRIVVRRVTRRDIDGIVRLWQALADERRYIATERVTVEQKNRWVKSIHDRGVLWVLAEMEGEEDCLDCLLYEQEGDSFVREVWIRHRRNEEKAVLNSWQIRWRNHDGSVCVELQWIRRLELHVVRVGWCVVFRGGGGMLVRAS